MGIDPQNLLAITAQKVPDPELIPAEGNPTQLAVQCMFHLSTALLRQWNEELRMIQHDVDVEPVIGAQVLYEARTQQHVSRKLSERG